ncbi:MAG: hypothetical protein ACYDAQ_02350 [Mycobacteriales bacterium]
MLRLVDPAAAERLEDAIRKHRGDAVDAQFAFADLAEAARRMVFDLLQDRSAEEHIAAAIHDSIVEGWSSEHRLEVAMRYLASVAGGADSESSGQTPDDFLFRQGLTGGWGEETHLLGIRQLRAALKSARWDEAPDV